MPIPEAAADADTLLHTLANGVRVVAITLPFAQCAQVSVFVRCGSQHEGAALNGISHMVEHMAFKGTRERDASSSTSMPKASAPESRSVPTRTTVRSASMWRRSMPTRCGARAELVASIDAVGVARVRAAFGDLLAAPATMALTGKLRPGVNGRVRGLVAPRHA